MADELWQTLLRFHREIAIPDLVERIVIPLREQTAMFRRETMSHFDAMYARFDRLESE